MNKKIADEMADLAQNSTYIKNEFVINKVLKLIKEKSQKGQRTITLPYSEFPQLKEISLKAWFITEGFNQREYNVDELTIFW